MRPKLSVVASISLLFVFWVNLHGEWIIGLMFLAVFAGLRIIDRSADRSAKIAAIGAIFISSIAKIVNPWSWRLLSEYILGVGSICLKGTHHPECHGTNVFQVENALDFSDINWPQLVAAFEPDYILNSTEQVDRIEKTSVTGWAKVYSDEKWSILERTE